MAHKKGIMIIQAKLHSSVEILELGFRYKKQFEIYILKD